MRRKMTKISHEHMRHNTRRIVRWSCTWVGSDYLSSVILDPAHDKALVMCSCDGFYFSSKKGRGHCYHVEELGREIELLHYRELERYEHKLAEAEEYLKKRRRSAQARPHKDTLRERVSEAEKMLSALEDDVRIYINTYPYICGYINLINNQWERIAVLAQKELDNG